tara:strand:+ start:797 stop:1063 length:267 start_codon:yes stop_codon:yes gene_type:complete
MDQADRLMSQEEGAKRDIDVGVQKAEALELTHLTPLSSLFPFSQQITVKTYRRDVRTKIIYEAVKYSQIGKNAPFSSVRALTPRPRQE